MTPERHATLLGLAGLVPFWGFALCAAFWPDPALRDLALLGEMVWGAIILSFMVGARWSMVLTNGAPCGPRLAVFGVLPAIPLAALFLSPALGLAVLFLTFAALLALELSPPARSEAPDWYPRLRIRLSVGAMSALALAWMVA